MNQNPPTVFHRSLPPGFISAQPQFQVLDFVRAPASVITNDTEESRRPMISSRPSMEVSPYILPTASNSSYRVFDPFLLRETSWKCVLQPPPLIQHSTMLAVVMSNQQKPEIQDEEVSPLNYSIDAKKSRGDGELNSDHRDKACLIDTRLSQTHLGLSHSHPRSPQSHPGSPQSHPGSPRTHLGLPQSYLGLQQSQSHLGLPQSHPGQPLTHPGSPRPLSGPPATDMVNLNNETAGLLEIDSQKVVMQHQGQTCERCQVCGGVAGKHHAYGGKVCHSCRAFFRRSVQTKYYEIFACTENENCNINSSTRKSCKYCRFKKCLQAKMQISWVLSEQERERRFNKLKKITFRNNFIPDSSETNTQMMTLPLHKTLEINFTIEEQLRLENLRDYVKAMAVPRYDYFFNCEAECLMHLAHASYFGGPLNYDLWKKFANASDLFHQEMFLNLDGMKELTMSDGLELIRSNGLASYSYLEAVYADEEDSGLSQSLKVAALSGQYPSMRSLLDILQRLNMTDKNPIIRYDQIYVSPWGASLEDEERHRTLLYKMKAFARPRGSSYGSSDPILTALMRIIIAFYPDFVALAHPDVCEKILHQHCMLLHRYIKKTYGDHANAKFAQAMATCANAREAAEILRRRIPS